MFPVLTFYAQRSTAPSTPAPAPRFYPHSHSMEPQTYEDWLRIPPLQFDFMKNLTVLCPIKEERDEGRAYNNDETGKPLPKDSEQYLFLSEPLRQQMVDKVEIFHCPFKLFYEGRCPKADCNYRAVCHKRYCVCKSPTKIKILFKLIDVRTAIAASSIAVILVSCMLPLKYVTILGAKSSTTFFSALNSES